MMRSSVTVTGVALLATLAGHDPLEAQGWPKGRARIVGTVIDTVSRRPIVRARICRLVPLAANYQGQMCAEPDTAGRYVLDSLPAGQQVVTVHCSGVRVLDTRLLRVDTLRVDDDQMARIDVRTTAEQCDMRPYVVRRGTFAGHWVSGFEESRFQPCDGSPGGWLTLRASAVPPALTWPRSNDPYHPSVFVRFEGTVRGPWHYGHMGMSAYEFIADRLIEARPPGRENCSGP